MPSCQTEQAKTPSHPITEISHTACSRYKGLCESASETPSSHPFTALDARNKPITFPYPSYDLAGLSGVMLVVDPLICCPLCSIPETSLFFFFQNFSPLNRLRLLDSLTPPPPLCLRGVPRSSVSLLARRVMT